MGDHDRTALSPPSATFASSVPAAALPRRRPLVAVLPFTPGGDDASLRLLGNDIADLLRERLAQDPAAQAILISSDFLAKAPPHAVELICRELRIGYLISGQCHGTEPRASLYVELTDTRDWHIRWARFFRGTAHTLLSESGAEMGHLVANLRRELIEQPRR
jgi:TolB-like protein